MNDPRHPTHLSGPAGGLGCTSDDGRHGMELDPGLLHGHLDSWAPPARRLHLIGDHEALERSLRERGVDIVRANPPLRTGELGLLPLTASTALPDLSRWLGPGAQALPVLIHADSIALGPPVNRCGGELANLFAHCSGCSGEPGTELLEAAAARIESAVRRGAPWPCAQLSLHGLVVSLREWTACSEEPRLELAPIQATVAPGRAGAMQRNLDGRCAALRAECLQAQLERQGFGSAATIATRIQGLLAAAFLGRSDHGLSLRPTLVIDGEAGSTRLSLRVEDGILVASETWLHGVACEPRLQLECAVDHAARSQRFGLLGRALGWLEAGEAFARLRDSASAMAMGLDSGGTGHLPASERLDQGPPARPDPAWRVMLLPAPAGRAAHPLHLPCEQRTRPASGFLRQGPEPAGLVALLDSLRPGMLEPGLNLLLVHRTRADRLMRRVYRSRSNRWEALDTLDPAAGACAQEVAAAEAPGNRLYVLSALPGEQAGESLEGYLRRARDAGEWGQRLRLHLAAHGLSGYRLGRIDPDELAGALPGLRTGLAHVLTAVAVGIEAPAELRGGAQDR